MVSFIIWLVFMILIIRQVMKITKKNRAKNGTVQRGTYSTQAFSGRSGGTAVPVTGKSSRSAKKTEEEDVMAEQMLGYCSSDAPESQGITFRNLPPGADELSILIRANARREKALEQSMHREAAEAEAEARASQ